MQSLNLSSSTPFDEKKIVAKPTELQLRDWRTGEVIPKSNHEGLLAIVTVLFSVLVSGIVVWYIIIPVLKFLVPADLVK